MKIGKLTHTNSKGQLVIPQEYRELLGINSNVTLNIVLQKTGIFIQPIEKVIPEVAGEDMYFQTLKKTLGSWNNNSEQEKKTEQEKRKLELNASKKRKQSW